MAQDAQETERAVPVKHEAYRVWRNITPEERKERLQEVIRRVVNDERTEVIAKDMGLSRSALNMALLEYAEEDWKRAQVARAQSRFDRARDIRERMLALHKLDATEEDVKNGIACTTEMLTLARDEEKSAQWELERLCRRIYGQDAPPAQSGLTINLNLGGNGAVQSAKVIENDSQQ